jgi:hypothetical protein
MERNSKSICPKIQMYHNYNIKEGLTYKQWYAKTREVAIQRGRSHEQVMAFSIL